MTDHDTHDQTTELPRNSEGDPRSFAPPGDQATSTYAPESEPTTVQPVVAPAPAAAVQHDDDRHVTVRTETAGPRLDRIRWSAVWAGLAVALALYLFLQLALVAAGVVDLSEATSNDAWWSAGAALVAFLIGGVVAGATAVWRGVGDGLLHGIVMWAVGLVALIALAAFGGGIALGSFDTSSVFDQFTNADLDAAATSGDAEEAAGWAIIGLASALLASALGAIIGSKMWPKRRTDADDTYNEIRS
jgi:hypothetical protein